jgi:endonuclease/exonuclease/phosphatase family metal-dependent hydrolase
MTARQLLRLPAAFLLALLLAGALPASTLTLATYNVENYGPANRMTEAGFRRDYPKPETEKQALRQVLAAIRADVLVLQEMGSGPHLEELRRDLRREGLEYPHAQLAVAADPDRHVAILSRLPLRQVVTHSTLEFSYFGARERVKRGLLEATLGTAAGDLTVFGAHLKSRYTDRKDDPASAVRRAAEAVAIRDAILRRFPNPGAARFVLLGDFNDTRTSRPLAALQKRGNTQIAHLLPAHDSRGESWTHVFRREESYTRVDHILVSPALREAVLGGAAHIFDGDGVRIASDHRPVVVVLSLEVKR